MLAKLWRLSGIRLLFQTASSMIIAMVTGLPLGVIDGMGEQGWRQSLASNFYFFAWMMSIWMISATVLTQGVMNALSVTK